ncbi:MULTISPECIES: IclR family transcriptional regulator [Streptomyces]|uniref:Glycerol operon regulatory protein n=1 Tax=Streptomyces cadmiisoli TaxID=2184053 RepID=A0A2Z4ISU1_9ACTN|nr:MULTISPECIES: IclR family transcriptional regulator [Streptomyces]AWW35606.1 IclR family transcriptional regulator [Streptomyces cadmiisoli]KOV52611.1 ArsR family transcriptional regulator [Streptomyces sp. AS58]
MVKAVNTRSVDQEPAKGPVEKAIEVLEALVQPGGPHRLGEIARRTGLTKPTVHRHLRTMAEHGFAEPTEGGSYRAGPRLLGLAAAALSDSTALALARPVLDDLRRRTGHIAFYAVRHDADAVYLEQSEPAREYRMAARPGRRSPLYASGVGLAMLSALPPEEASAALHASDLVARTPHTLTEPAALRAELARAALCGYAVEDEYEEPDVRSVAAPVLNAHGEVVGAIGVSGLVFTMDSDSLEVFGPMVRAAARTVSAGLGAPTSSLSLMHTAPKGEQE